MEFWIFRLVHEPQEHVRWCMTCSQWRNTWVKLVVCFLCNKRHYWQCCVRLLLNRFPHYGEWSGGIWRENWHVCFTSVQSKLQRHHCPFWSWSHVHNRRQMIFQQMSQFGFPALRWWTNDHPVTCSSLTFSAPCTLEVWAESLWTNHSQPLHPVGPFFPCMNSKEAQAHTITSRMAVELN